MKIETWFWLELDLTHSDTTRWTCDILLVWNQPVLQTAKTSWPQAHKIKTKHGLNDLSKRGRDADQAECTSLPLPV